MKKVLEHMDKMGYEYFRGLNLDITDICNKIREELYKSSMKSVESIQFEVFNDNSITEGSNVSSSALGASLVND